MAHRSLPRVRRNICVLLLSLLVLSWGYFAFSFRRDYLALEQECHARLQTLSISFEAHAQHIVQVIDILLLEITRHYTHYSAAELQATVRDWFQRSPELALLAVIDVQSGGKLFSLNNQQLPEGFVPAAYTRQGQSDDLQIAAKLFPGDGGRKQLAFYRQFNCCDRKLLVVFFLYADIFLDFHPEVDLGMSGSVAMFHQQGLLLARNPDNGLVGQSYADAPLFTEALTVNSSGISNKDIERDGIERIVAHRKITGQPLVVTVGTSKNWIFSDWQSRLLNFLVIQVVVTVTVLISMMVLLRTLARVEKAEITLSEREEHFRATANSSVDAVISVNDNDRVSFWSAGAEKTFGCPSSEALNMPITCFLQFAEHGNPLTLKQLAEVNAPWSTNRTLDVQGQRKNGEIFPTELSISRGTVSGRSFYTLIVRDVTERRQMEERIRRMASHDNLTGLPNRTLLMDRLQVAMAQVRRHGGQFALLFVDLDKFKPVNDNFGHDVGDLLLQEVARRMQSRVRASDTVARIGGDEFALLFNDITERAAVRHACTNLLQGLQQEFSLNDIRVQISCSIGVTFFAGGEQSASDIIKQADNAMYAAKRAGQNCYRFAEAEESAESGKSS